jgi:hypothetical protein
MSNPELERYKELYNSMVTTIANYHNRNQDFLKKTTELGAQDLRRMLRELRKTEKEMLSLVWDIFLIEKKGRAEARRLKQQNTALRKTMTPPRVHKKKENKDE